MLENTTAVGTVLATDANSQDNVTAYAFTGSSADTTDFNLDTTTGVLTFKTAPDYESPTDRASTTPVNAAGNNEYLVIVQATGGAGDRAMTANDTIVVAVTNVEIPVAPTGLQATAGDATAILEWTDPEDPSITAYQYSVDSGANWLAIPNSGAGTTGYTVPGLTNGTPYVLQLRAINGEGSGASGSFPSVTPLSSDATLSALVISEGTLSPTFASTVTAYKAAVANTITSLTVTPTVNESNATVTVEGATVASGTASNPRNLDIGDNEIPVVVTAQNTTTTMTYTVAVVRQIAVTGGTGPWRQRQARYPLRSRGQCSS